MNRLFAAGLSALICVNCMAADWELLKIDDHYAEINSDKGLVLSIGKVDYKDVVQDVTHMSEINKCDKPVFADKNESFIVRNCKIGNIKQNVYARIDASGSDEMNTDAKLLRYVQVYLVGDELSDLSYEKEALAFLDKNYIDNPYQDWIVNKVSSEPSAMLVENQYLKTVITVNLSEYPHEENFSKDKYISELAKTLLCEDTELTDGIYVMSRCSTFKVYEVRDLKDSQYVIYGISSDSYSNPEVKNKIGEIHKKL